MVVLGTGVARAQDVSDLLPFVPRDANALAVLRVKALTGSPRGQKEGWAARHESQYLDGAVTIPPWVEVLVRASFVRPGTRGGDWTTVLTPLPDGVEMTQLAVREGTEVQEISNRPAVLSERHSGYFVEFKGPGESGRRILGGMAPASRQDAARWIAEAGRATGAEGVSPYLVESVQDSTPQLVLALDMHDMLDPVHVRSRLDAAEAIQGQRAARAALIIAFQTLRGIRFSVRVQETTTAEVRFDFGRRIGDEGKFVKPLFVEFLNDAGAALDELESAEVKVDGQTVTLRTPLSDESLRRVLSLITAPPPPHSPGRAAQATPAPPQPASGPDAIASRRYFQAVSRNVDDLRRAYARAQSYTRTAQWHDNFAQRIDHLPTAGVDPALVDYGRRISSQLRALGASLRGTGVKVNALDRTVVYQTDYVPANGFEWWWGGARTAWGPVVNPQNVVVTSNLQEVRAKQAEVVAAAAPERDQIWQIINDERDAMERQMVGKFGEQFRR
jgi:hypothetical protein